MISLQESIRMYSRTRTRALERLGLFYAYKANGSVAFLCLPLNVNEFE
jgi:hypothetical protein